MTNATKVVYLDTKDWIELARGYYEKSQGFQKIAQIVVDKSGAGQAIFPLSIIHFSETVRNLNPARRRRLAEYMILVSHGWAILPAPTIISPEIENACLEYMGLPPRYTLENFVFKKGISQLMGARGTLVAKNGTKVPPELERQILDKIESADTLLWFMRRGLSSSHVIKGLKAAEDEAKKLEQIRQSFQSKFKDNDLLRRAILGDYLVYSIGPKLMPFLASVHPNPKQFIYSVYKDRAEIIRFFQSMPTSYCNVQLTIFRDMQAMRKIQANDLHDIMGLSIAIPYSDVVVTERMWHTAIKQTGLDKLYKTNVLKSAKDLTPILDS